jgi:hypothetical protein
MSRGYMGARSQFDLGDEDHPVCDNCGDGSGWTVWRTRIYGGELRDFALFVACADCNDDQLKPYPTPWPVCHRCEESAQFCTCLREQLEGFNISVN